MRQQTQFTIQKIPKSSLAKLLFSSLQRCQKQKYLKQKFKLQLPKMTHHRKKLLLSISKKYNISYCIFYFLRWRYMLGVSIVQFYNSNRMLFCQNIMGAIDNWAQMKEQPWSEQFIKQEDIQRERQHQSDDPHQQKLFHQIQPKVYHNNKSHQNFICFEKAAFIQLRQSKRQLIKSILCGQLMNETISMKIIQKNALVLYLEKIQQPRFRIQPQMFNKALMDFKGLFMDEITNIWRKLSKQQRAKYEQIGMRNRTMMEQLQGEQSVDKYGGFEMLKIDFLCVFFLYNNHFVRAFGDTKRKLFGYRLLAKMFDFDPNYIAKMSCKFKQEYKDISIEYRPQINEYIELLAVIQLGYNVQDYIKSKQSDFQSMSKVDIQLFANITDANYYSKDVGLRFSQIAYKSIAKMLRMRRSARFKLKASASAISYQRKQILLEISKEYSISYYILLEINTKMDENRYISKQQFVSYFEKNLSKCQWVFLKGRRSLLEGINAAFGNKFKGSTIYYRDGRIGFKSFLAKLALERFALLSNIFKMQIKLEHNVPIFAYRFQYSLRDIQNSKQKDQENIDFQQQQDLKCSLIMLTANSQIVAYAFCRNVLSHDGYLNLVKLCTKRKVTKYTKQLNLIIYGFDYKHTIHSDPFAQLQIYINKKFGGRVYMLNDPQFFRPHFLVNSFLRSFLSKLNLNRQNFYWYFELCTHKLLKRIQGFEKTTNEEYFAYFAKIMSLQMGIKQVWRCFQKDRGNRYNAVILGGGDIEKLPKKHYQLQLDQDIPFQQWFYSIQNCQPSYNNFITYQEGEKWRDIQLFQEEYPKDLKSFLTYKHMQEKDIKRVLMGVTNFLIYYQLYFEQLVSGKRKIKQEPQKEETIAWLRDFYIQQNKNIEQVYSRSQREAIFCQFAKIYQNLKKIHLQNEDNKHGVSLELKSQE